MSTLKTCRELLLLKFPLCPKGWHKCGHCVDGDLPSSPPAPEKYSKCELAQKIVGEQRTPIDRYWCKFIACFEQYEASCDSKNNCKVWLNFEAFPIPRILAKCGGAPPPTFSAPGPFFTTWVKRKCDFRYPSKSHIPKRGAFSVFKIDKENNRVISCRRYEKNGTGCRTFCSKKLLSGESLKIFFPVCKLFLYETAAVYWYFDHSDRLDLGELWFLGVAERADFSISWCYDLYRKTIDSGLEPELVTKTVTNPFTKKWTFKEQYHFLTEIYFFLD